MMKTSNLGVGPMSREIIRCIDNYDKLLMIVASRNQVDYDNGYVCKTNELSSLIDNKNILLCRDHCGPYFSDKDKNLSLSESLEECKKTIREDLTNGFKLIHIDVSRISHHQLEYAQELIEFTLDLNPDVLLEFGSEDNTGEGLEPSIGRITEQLEFLQKYKSNVEFFVTQTGSFTQHMQMGNFNVEFNKQTVEKVHSYDFKFKEHNADYLNKEEINHRRIVGIDALNIAPQLGTIQTKLLKELSNNNKEWYEFSKRTLDSNLWTKWLPREVNNKELAVIVAGHYMYSTIEYKRLINTIDIELFNENLKTEIYNIFDLYIK